MDTNLIENLRARLRSSHANIPFLAAGLLLASCTHTSSPLSYPITARVGHVDTYDGTQVADPYRWLEDDNSF